VKERLADRRKVIASIAAFHELDNAPYYMALR
jgi:hypothetical protein